MHHKRGRPKARRAGCLFCKPNKLGQGMERMTTGQGARKEIIAAADVRDHFIDPGALKSRSAAPQPGGD